jgi:phosphoserine phosphatase RsbU/P
MSTIFSNIMRDQLLDRQQKLATALTRTEENPQLKRLLHEVDTALEKIEAGTFGICEVCHDPVEADRLMADPLVRFCLDHLSPLEQVALERDLETAAQIQRALIPPPQFDSGEWRVHHYYEPFSIVSGDYIDLIRDGDDGFYALLGDVSGKGVAAAMLMSNLHALVRTLISVGLSLNQIVSRTSRLFCESTLPSFYATLICIRAGRDGQIEICNAGHLPVLRVNHDGVTQIESAETPVGMFCEQNFNTRRVQLDPGDQLLLYSDGLTEAQDVEGREYGIERLTDVVRQSKSNSPATLVEACLSDWRRFRAGAPRNDDLTVMAIRWL